MDSVNLIVKRQWKALFLAIFLLIVYTCFVFAALHHRQLNPSWSCDNGDLLMMQSLSRAQNYSTVPEIKSRKSLFYKNVLWPIMTPIDLFTSACRLPGTLFAHTLTVINGALYNSQLNKIGCEKTSIEKHFVWLEIKTSMHHQTF